MAKKTQKEGGRPARQSRGQDARAPETVEYRHNGVTRLNIPPAGLAARGNIAKEPKLKWAYNPHLSPALRFDGTGGADKIEKLIAESGKRKLTPEEMAVLEEAFRNHEPWLEWAGKREQQWCVADPVALNIHERISTQAVLKVAKRLDVQRDLFADPEHEYREAVQFYKHSMDWTNRMILGDSLAVMASLARREAMAGKVQMIYMDPPYGIKYASNFQPEVGRRDVKDKDEDLTREPEMVKAYRDTWTLGVHTYLSYLRDRLLLCKELLADSGSVFVQISDENLHRVRAVMDEVFGCANFCGIVGFQKTGSMAANLLPSTVDYILWYAKERERVRYRQLFDERRRGHTSLDRYDLSRLESGATTRANSNDSENVDSRFQLTSLFSDGAASEPQSFAFRGVTYQPKGNSHWKTTIEGLERLSRAERIERQGDRLRYFRFAGDFNYIPISDRWESVQIGKEAQYVVQTASQVIERCLLMTTDPGDLVLDPTCGSGTTAYVAENWGRRWITLDVSRVALAIARQRLLTAKFEFYKLRPTSAEDVARNPDGPWLTHPDRSAGVPPANDGFLANGGRDARPPVKYTFDCKTVPHVTLKSIAQNQALDPIFDKWEPILAEKLAALNKALGSVSDELRNRLKLKLAAKEKADGKKSITDADRRRWILPQRSAGVSPVIPGGRDARPPVGWQHWEVPFDTDPDWPKALQDALTEYRKAWRGKMDEVNACIAARADQEELVDQPFVEKGKVRVSGPFTMEGVIPAEESIDDEESPIIGAPEELPTWEGGRPARHENDAGETPAPPFLNPFDEIEMKEHRLPHWQQGECYVFVTWRLADSLPKEKLDAWRERKAAFMKACPPPWDEKTAKAYHRQFSDQMDEWLDAGEGSCLLRDPVNAKIVADALRYFEGERYDLDAFVVMPNHIHVLFRPKSGHALSDIVHSWKSFTAKELLKHGGRDARPPVDRVWQEDYWDRLIRNERHLNACRRYIVENPTRAHLEDGSFVLHGSAGVSPVIPGGQNARADDPGGQDARPPMRFDPQNAEAYLDKMIRLLREDGVRFPDNKAMKFSALEIETGGSAIHARGTWVNGDKKERQVAVIVGPQYGALNALIVEEGIGRARRGGFDDLVFAAFSFDGAAQALIQEDPDPKLRIHMAQIRPDVNMGDLLKTTVSSQLFTVSGSPRTTVENMEGGRLARQDRGQDARDPVYVVHMEGVDLYDPVTNSVRSTGAEKVAAWFLDSDYDGRCFCVCQAFFPDKSAWAKLGKALGGALDEDAFARLSGTVSLPFPEGEHKRIAVKVIDPRGNEVLRVHRLDGKYGD